MNPNDEDYGQENTGPREQPQGQPPPQNSRPNILQKQKPQQRPKGPSLGDKLKQGVTSKIKDKAKNLKNKVVDKVKSKVGKIAKDALEKVAKKWAKSALKNGAKQLAKQGVKRGIQGLIALSGAATYGVGTVVAGLMEVADQAQQLIRHPKKYLKTWGKRAKWALIAALCVVFFIIMTMMILIVIISGSSTCQEGLNVTMSGPEKASNGDKLEYTIDVSDNKKPTEIKISTHIPDDTEFQSADNDGKYDAGSRTVTWTLKQDGTVALSLKATKDNDHVVIFAEAEAKGESGNAEECSQGSDQNGGGSGGDTGN